MTDGDWQERLSRASAESLRRRLARADARRAATERRRHGIAQRLAWRQTRRDARDADHGPSPPCRRPLSSAPWRAVSGRGGLLRASRAA